MARKDRLAHNKRNAKVKTLKAIPASKAIERELSKGLKGLTKDILASYEYHTLAQFNKFNRSEIGNLSNALEAVFNKLLRRWESKASDIADKLAERTIAHADKYVNVNFSQQGIELATRKNKTPTMKAMYLQQIELIKSIPRDIMERYKGAFYNAVAGFSQDSLLKLARNIGKVSEKRARLIARDQTAKAIEAFTMERTQSLGLEFYQWQTAQDERVSDGKGGHRVLHDRIYRYDEPTAVIDSYDNKGHPAQRVNCRCVALAVLLEPNQRLKKIKDSSAGDYYIIENI